MNSEHMTFVMLPKEEWDSIQLTMREVLKKLQQISATVASPVVNYITAKEFMDAVRIKRTKFDQLVAENKVKILKKGRKIYVDKGEVERYFSDPFVK
ncbi:MAG: helix-turn-helix domain-containing protein [Chitinophagaceae bacterium]|nr:helix-turn-helix domain-containing protein [Chitinophagaceae bacterium]